METQLKLLSLIMDNRKIDAFEASEYLLALNPELTLETALEAILNHRGL
jgi:hypothetical protein